MISNRDIISPRSLNLQNKVIEELILLHTCFSLKCDEIICKTSENIVLVLKTGSFQVPDIQRKHWSRCSWSYYDWTLPRLKRGFYCT